MHLSFSLFIFHYLFNFHFPVWLSLTHLFLVAHLIFTSNFYSTFICIFNFHMFIQKFCQGIPSNVWSTLICPFAFNLSILLSFTPSTVYVYLIFMHGVGTFFCLNDSLTLWLSSPVWSYDSPTRFSFAHSNFIIQKCIFEFPLAFSNVFFGRFLNMLFILYIIHCFVFLICHHLPNYTSE